MNTTQDLSIISLVIHASLLAQARHGAAPDTVRCCRGLSSSASGLPSAAPAAQTERFERDFWSGGDLQALYQSAANNRHTIGALERIFESGMREFLKGKRSACITDPGAILDGARRAMRAAFQREMDVPRSESRVSRVGQLGEPVHRPVRHGLGDRELRFAASPTMQQATLANVAPGIAEALTATAIGLFAAIPAVVA